MKRCVNMALSLTVLTLLSGCGGGAEAGRGATFTKAEFISTIDDICAETAERYDDVEPPAEGATPEDAGAWLREMIVLNQQQQAEMKAVSAPADMAPVKRAILEAVDRIRAGYQDALAAVERKNAQAYADALGDVEQVKFDVAPDLERHGFTTCAGA